MSPDELARAYLPLTRAAARRACRVRHLRDEAESAALVGLAQALKVMPRAGPGFAALVETVVRRRVRDMLRGERRRDAAPDRGEVDRLTDGGPPPHAPAEAAEEFERLCRVLRAPERRVLRLVFGADLTPTEAARAMGIPKRSAHYYYHRALAVLSARVCPA
jgi:RNA polymerase sigma factor (sigma-70 family)